MQLQTRSQSCEDLFHKSDLSCFRNCIVNCLMQKYKHIESKKIWTLGNSGEVGNILQVVKKYSCVNK